MENQVNSTREMHESQSSVEVSVNSKGLWSAKVKAYADTTEEAMLTALNKAKDLDTLIRSKNKITV
jgi:hypothetical protein